MNMTAAEGLLTALERNWDMIDGALHGLDDAALARCPTDQCNSIAWTLWHMNRVLDTFVHTRLQSQPQLWIRDGWHDKFGMSADPEDRGVGWTAAQVTAWAPPAQQVQIGYYAAVKNAARAYLSTLSYVDLEEQRVIPPVADPRSVAAALGQVTWDNVAHGGQIAYIRGLFDGRGWYDR
jgi:hypothetical protein